MYFSTLLLTGMYTLFTGLPLFIFTALHQKFGSKLMLRAYNFYKHRIFKRKNKYISWHFPRQVHLAQQTNSLVYFFRQNTIILNS